MIVYNNQAPANPNNVGQFGATEGSIGAYKQAAEYAADSKYWALLAESKFGTIDDLIAQVERLYQQGVLLREDIEDLKQDFAAQDIRLMNLIAQTNAAVADANNSVALIDQKIVEVQKQLDVLMDMKVTVTTLPPGSQATGSFDNQTGEIKLGIPEGDKGADGSVTDLSTVSSGTPELGDLGFYVDKDDNTVHKTTLEDIANLIPSVRSISVNGGEAQDGDVALTLNKTTVGLGNVLNVAQYSRQEINDKFDKPIKIYQSKAEADANAQYRQEGESVLVWEDTQYVFYTVAANKTLTPVKSESRILTVNSRSPDSTGNIDITIPTGNPSLYLGEMVMFPYDPNKNVSYPGVLPADGRLVSKENASDLGPSLVSGQLPVVSETEWQAGAKQYFSWGKLADGVTDADSTNYISIRLPDWTGGEAIRAPDADKDSQYDGTVQSQKPYVVTVNNQAPDEATGNVTISRTALGAASSGANSDITSITGLTTALSVSQGGTGATTVDSARSNLKVDRLISEAGETGLWSDNKSNKIVMWGPGDSIQWGCYNNKNAQWNALAVDKGGTGALTAADARTNLGLGSISTLNNVPVANGGTGATDAAGARTNLGLGNISTLNNVPVASGGTGATNASGARSNLGLGSASVLNVGHESGQVMVVGPSRESSANPQNKVWEAIYEPYAPGNLFPDSCVVQILPGPTQYEWGSIGISYGPNNNVYVAKASYDTSTTTGKISVMSLLNSLNTTIDTNGFIKAASPIVKVFHDGSFETNEQSEGVSVERVSTGVYLISKCLGLNSDASWGGVGGGFEIPCDINKQARIWLDYEVNEDGSILIKTYHRTHADSPSFAQNNIEGFSDGDPIDIPKDAFISVRVEMPSK